jgi:hypothetical protein
VPTDFDKKKKFNQISFRLTGPDGHPRVQIGTRTRLDPGVGSDAPAGQFSDPHSQPTGAKSTTDPPHRCRLPSLIYVEASPVHALPYFSQYQSRGLPEVVAPMVDGMGLAARQSHARPMVLELLYFLKETSHGHG